MQAGTLFEHTIYSLQANHNQIAFGRCHVVDASGNPILWAVLLGFPSVKIRVYLDKYSWTAILRVNRPREFGPMAEIHDYPVLDPIEKARIGTVRLTNDGWILLDQSHQRAGLFKQVQASESMPKHEIWDGYVDDVLLCQIHYLDLGIDLKMTVDCSLDPDGKLDRRLTLSSALVRMALEVERRQPAF